MVVNELVLPDVVEEKKQPFTYAPITFCEADQGEGKTTVLVARAVGDTYSNMNRIILFKDGEPYYEVKASPALNGKGKAVVGYATVHFPDSEPYIVEVPDDACVIADGVKVFSNFHFHGIRYAYTDFAEILEYINDDYYFTDGWLLIDEGHLGANARRSMEALAQLLTADLLFSIRKRRLHLMLGYAMGKTADLRFKIAQNEHIIPHYNPDTYEITMTVKKRGEKMKVLKPFYAPLYWRYFDTEERHKVPEKHIQKAWAEAL